MPYSYFPWDDIGLPYEMRERDITETLETEFIKGPPQTRARFTQIPKEFEFSLREKTTDQKMYFVEFWRSVFGKAGVFFWQYPLEIAGFPGAGGFGIEDDPTGFINDPDAVDSGAGEGPYFKVRFANEPVEMTYNMSSQRWAIGPVVVRQVI